MIRRRYLITGRVQGVGYRRFVEKKASPLGIQGGVRNLTDGRVEVWAMGSSEQHEELRRNLDKGPLLAKVTNVELSEVLAEWPLLDQATEFKVYVDGEAPWVIPGV